MNITGVLIHVNITGILIHVNITGILIHVNPVQMHDMDSKFSQCPLLVTRVVETTSIYTVGVLLIL